MPAHGRFVGDAAGTLWEGGTTGPLDGTNGWAAPRANPVSSGLQGIDKEEP